jgi:hypothetical protein
MEAALSAVVEAHQAVLRATAAVVLFPPARMGPRLESAAATPML